MDGRSEKGSQCTAEFGLNGESAVQHSSVCLVEFAVMSVLMLYHWVLCKILHAGQYMTVGLRVCVEKKW